MLKLIRSTLVAAPPNLKRISYRIMGSPEESHNQEDTSTIVRLQDIKPLCDGHCRMKDPARVERILNEFIRGGAERMQLVSDFDFTITKQRTADGKPVLSSFGILNACKSLPPKFIEESNKLYHKYRPIEIDPHIPTPEKIKHMIDWWTKTGELLV